MTGRLTAVYLTAQDEWKHYIISPHPSITVSASLLSSFIIVLIYTSLWTCTKGVNSATFPLIYDMWTITRSTGPLLRKIASVLFQSRPPSIRPSCDPVVLSQQYLVSLNSFPLFCNVLSTTVSTMQYWNEKWQAVRRGRDETSETVTAPPPPPDLVCKWEQVDCQRERDTKNCFRWMHFYAFIASCNCFSQLTGILLLFPFFVFFFFNCWMIVSCKHWANHMSIMNPIWKTGQFWLGVACLDIESEWAHTKLST